MFILTAVLAILSAAVLLVSARGKLVHDDAQMAIMRRVGFPEQKVSLLATAEMAGAVGIVVGLWWWPVGIAAATGVVAYFLGAISAHLRKRDYDISAAVVLLTAAIAVLVLRALTV
jgi:hypothetical protein